MSPPPMGVQAQIAGAYAPMSMPDLNAPSQMNVDQYGFAHLIHSQLDQAQQHASVGNISKWIL